MRRLDYTRFRYTVTAKNYPDFSKLIQRCFLSSNVHDKIIIALKTF